MEPILNLFVFHSTKPFLTFDLSINGQVYPMALTAAQPDQSMVDDGTYMDKLVDTLVAPSTEGLISIDPTTFALATNSTLYAGTLNADLTLGDYVFGWSAAISAYVPQVVTGKELGDSATEETIQVFVGTACMAYENVKCVPDLVEIPATETTEARTQIKGFVLQDGTEESPPELALVSFNEYLLGANLVFLLESGQDRILAFVRAYNSVFFEDPLTYFKIGLFKSGLQHLNVIEYGSRLLATRPNARTDNEGVEYVASRIVLERNLTLGAVYHPVMDVYIPVAEGSMRYVSIEGLSVTYNGYAGWLVPVVNDSLRPYNHSLFGTQEAVDVDDSEASDETYALSNDPVEPVAETQEPVDEIPTEVDAVPDGAPVH